jgi:hypothetical protein
MDRSLFVVFKRSASFQVDLGQKKAAVVFMTAAFRCYAIDPGLCGCSKKLYPVQPSAGILPDAYADMGAVFS